MGFVLGFLFGFPFGFFSLVILLRTQASKIVWKDGRVDTND